MYVNNYMMDCRPMGEIGGMGYGLGVIWLPQLGYGHGGDGSGTSVRAFHDPDKDFTIVLFINAWNYKNGLGDNTYFQAQQLEIFNLLYLIKEAIYR